jgi:DNA invertase Pin-like site-specific DNA recombinase
MLIGYARVSIIEQDTTAQASALREHGIDIEDEALTHLSPIGWEHVNLTGDYT